MDNATINPICVGCQGRIGDMELDIYLKAIAARGEYLFCPECRKHKCDCCGWFMPPFEVRKVRDKAGKFLGNACESCWEWVISDEPTKSDFPNFSCNAKPNLVNLSYSAQAPTLKVSTNVR